MNNNIKKIFTFMFQDNNFKFKAFLLWIFVSISIYCSMFFYCKEYSNYCVSVEVYTIIFLICLFCYALTEGYRIFFIKALRKNEELPVISLKNNLITGVKFLCAYIICLIPINCIIAAFCFNAGYIAYPEMYINVSLIISIICIIMAVMFVSVILPASIFVFTETNSVWSFYKYEEIFKIIKSNKKKYTLVVIISFLTFLIECILSKIICLLGINYNYWYLGLCFLLSLPMVYLFFVINGIIAELES